MAKFKPYKLLSSKLSSLPIVEGQLVLATDTKKLYFDIDSKTRILVNSDAVVGFTVSGKTVTYTKANGTTGTFDTQDTNTTYSVVTTEKDGLMSKDMLTKLNGIAAGAQVNTVTGVKGSSETNYRTGNINITKANIGLSNVENKSSATIRGELTNANVTTALGYTPLNSNLKGAKSGLAELDANGKVPSTQLPSYVDDVLEGYLSNGKFYKESEHTTEITGETGKIYVDLSNNKTYRWSGTAFTEISASLALGETSSTAYRGDHGKVAYDHASAKGSAFTSGLYKITTNAQGHVTAATAVAKADITALGIPGTNTTYSKATANADGLMSKEHFSKLNSIAAGAQVNTITGVKGNAETNYRTGNVNITAANIGLGNAIISGSQTTTSTVDGGSNVYTFTDVAGNTSTITVKNGSKGSTGAQGTKGDKGDTGPQGPAGTTPTIKAANGTNINTVGTPSVTASTSGTTTTFTFNNLKGATGSTGPQGPKGDTGPQGVKGNTGATGTRGSRWTTGTACTGNSTTGTVFNTGITDALVNDMYLNTSTGFVYKCTTAGNASTAKWAYVGSIKGNTGAQGAKGDTGSQGPQGNTGPAGTAAGFGTPTASVDANVGTPSVTVTASGANTSKVFNFAFKNLKGATGATGPKGDTGPQGPKGTNGTNGTSAAWFTGTAVTGTSTNATAFTVSGSKAGDMYLNTSTQNVYRAAAANSWIYVCNIKGATGSKGGTGAAAGFGTPTATVDANTGTPSVTITTSGSNTAKIFNFAFKNLKGATGPQGPAGKNATTTAVATTSANGLLPKLAGGTAKYLRADGTWVTPPNTNTTYAFATGDNNGQIKVTPSGGTATNVSVKGLAAAAYKAVDTTLSTTSTNVPTSKAVADYITGLGMLGWQTVASW